MTTSFYDFLNSNTTSQGQSVARMASEKQMQWYQDLCKRKNVQVENYRKMTAAEISTKIEELKILGDHVPASPKQLEMVNDLLTRLKGYGLKFDNLLVEYDLNNLTGGREGSASKIIDLLIKIDNASAEFQPITDQQLKRMLPMYLCIDCPFEEFYINRKVEIGVDKENGASLWRKLTPAEWENELRRFKRNDASNFLDRFEPVFTQWKNTRIKPSKIEYIQKLQARLIHMDVPSEVELKVDINGNITQYEPKKVVDKATKYDPIAFVPLTVDQLIMFDEEQAEKYIQSLKWESKQTYSYYEASDNSTNFEELRTNDDPDTIESGQKAGTHKAAMQQQFIVLQDIIFRLEAVGGYHNELAHEVVNSLLVHDDNFNKKADKAKATLRDYMLFLIDEGYIDISSIIELVRESKLMTNLLLGRA